MAIILEIDDLTYQNFKHINLSFEEKTFYSIVGSNNCGKTTLFKLLSGFIPSNGSICCNDIDLNDDSLFEYITNIGVVDRVNKESFIYGKVLDEMLYPLLNLGYSKDYAKNRIKEVLKLFNKENIQDMKINELNYYDKELLMIMIAILHEPKVLLLDSVLDIFPKDQLEKIIKTFRKLVRDGMTIISFTNSLDNAIFSNKIILMGKYEIIGTYSPRDIFKDDKLFYEHNLEIPFLIDLSNKLKMYNIIDKEYLSMIEMVDDIWP